MRKEGKKRANEPTRPMTTTHPPADEAAAAAAAAAAFLCQSVSHVFPPRVATNPLSTANDAAIRRWVTIDRCTSRLSPLVVADHRRCDVT